MNNRKEKRLEEEKRRRRRTKNEDERRETRNRNITSTHRQRDPHNNQLPANVRRGEENPRIKRIKKGGNGWLQ
jgi:hypothetical protein